MIPTDLLLHTVTRIRPAVGTDAWNATTLDYDAGATRTAGLTVRIQQDTRAEVYLDGRTPAEQRWTMFANDTDWNRTDRVEWDEGPDGLLVFEIFGEPEPTYDNDSLHHLEATLRIVDG